MLKRLGLGIFLLWGVGMNVSADEVTDVGTDVEEMSADSEAALATAAETKARLAREKHENVLKLREAVRERGLAERKRAEAAEQLGRDERELDHVRQVRKQTQSEIDRLDKQIALANDRMGESRAKTENARRELASVTQEKINKQKKLSETSRQAAEAKRAEAQAANQLRAEKNSVAPHVGQPAAPQVKVPVTPAVPTVGEPATMAVPK